MLAEPESYPYIDDAGRKELRNIEAKKRREIEERVDREEAEKLAEKDSQQDPKLPREKDK